MIKHITEHTDGLDGKVQLRKEFKKVEQTQNTPLKRGDKFRLLTIFLIVEVFYFD